MNERIKQLVEKSYIYDKQNDSSFFDKEKFAELIVRECANRASWAQDTNEADIGGEVLKHFGVDE
jgi:cysteinyl-tRNA synthetase